MNDLKYIEILEKNSELGKHLSGPSYDIAVLSNITTSQLNEILEYSLRSHEINA